MMTFPHFANPWRSIFEGAKWKQELDQRAKIKEQDLFISKESNISYIFSSGRNNYV